MTEQHTCPRRIEDGRADPDSPFVGSGTGLDGWRTGAAGPECSYCGSLHPDRFMELVREGWIVGPTDKTYKAYLGKPLTDDDIAASKTRWLDAPHGIAHAIRELGEQDGKTPEQIAADLERRWTNDELPRLTDSCGMEGKFYFQHLSSEQRDEFIALHNNKQMRIGTPGHFYQRPFFTAAARAE